MDDTKAMLVAALAIVVVQMTVLGAAFWLGYKIQEKMK